jgi:hypothetical protein
MRTDPKLTFFNNLSFFTGMFWLEVDNSNQIATLHRGECIHIAPVETDRKGINQMRTDGGWFSFESVGEAMRFFKVKRLSGEINYCLLCRPLDHLEDVSMARLDITEPRTGCEACVKEVEVVDTKSSYRRLLSKLLGSK